MGCFRLASLRASATPREPLPPSWADDGGVNDAELVEGWKGFGHRKEMVSNLDLDSVVAHTLPMPTEDWKPAEHPFVIPYLYVRDAQAASDFYAKAFGFKEEFSRPGPGGVPMHVEMSWHSGRIMMAPDGAWDAPQKSPATTGIPSSMNLYIYVPNVDSFFEQAVAGGAQPLGQPQDSFWGDRITSLMCPDGYVWTFATKVAEFDPSKGPNF